MISVQSASSSGVQYAKRRVSSGGGGRVVDMGGGGGGGRKRAWGRPGRTVVVREDNREPVVGSPCP
jgi:hypothetical protein